MSFNIILHLSLIESVGSDTMHKIADVLGVSQDWSEVYKWSSEAWMAHGFSPRKAEKIVAGLRNQNILNEELRLMERLKIRSITYYDTEYPEILRESDSAPFLLYVQENNIPRWQSCKAFLACVASRKATDYTYRTAKTLFAALKDQLVCIVSGGAIGGDSFIHKAALEYGLPTVAVIGSGLTRPYPSVNKELFEHIVKSGGALISPFSMTTLPTPGTFPARNHVIAGMSHATLVFQGTCQSGTLITARSALAQGRDVGAIPGPIDHELSRGCHALIAQGALLISGPDDIVQLLKLDAQTNKHRDVPPLCGAISDTISTQDTLLFLCRTPHTIHELSEKTGRPMSEIQNELFSYFVNGTAKQDILGRWQATKA